MTFKPDIVKTKNRARTGGSGTRGIALGGGGIGALLLAGLLWYFGIDSNQIQDILGSQDTSVSTQSTTGYLDHCQTGADANNDPECRVEFTASSLDKIWSEILPKQAGISYVEPMVVVFRGSTSSGCGTASASTGPFYCPADQGAYFDVTFFDQLANFGAVNTPLAQEYIVAHEFGHHIQQLQGTLKLSNYNDPGPDSNAVRIELQADCYAGIWAYHADKGEDAYLEPITQEQLQSAIDAARSVGDDNIQSRSGGEVRPDLFTHGTSEQRQAAFMSGYQTGQLSSCTL